MPNFLPPVVAELRANGSQAIAEMGRVGAAARAMADNAIAQARREVVASQEAAGAARAAASERTAAAEAAMRAQTAAAARTAEARKVAAAQEIETIRRLNTAVAEGSMTVKEAAAAQAAAVERSAAQITAAEREEAAAAKQAAAAQVEASAAIRAARDASTRSDMAAMAVSDSLSAKRAANARAFVQASNTVSAAALGAAAIIGVASVEEAAHFEKATTLLVTAGGESKAQLGSVREGILSIARDTGTSTEQLADGMYIMEKASYRGADGLKVLRAAAEGAAAENVDLATMSQAVTDVLLDYGLGADKAVSVTNQMVTASGLAKTTMQDFASSMAAIIPTGSVAKLSFAQLGGALATMTQHGQTAQQSSQNLANLLTQLARPSQVASKAMQQMGVDVTDLSMHLGDENGGRGLMGSLQLIDQHIRSNMGKDGEIVTSVMKKSASATADLQTMIKQMPPDLAELSKGFLDGSVSQIQYQKGFKSMGGTADALGNQFLSLAKSSLGVNDLIKSGQPAMQTYIGAWNRAAGGITGARTALMLLMNNSAEFKHNIEMITEAGNQNGQHVETWAETEKTFAVQLGQTKESARALAIEMGTRLLPVAKDMLGGFRDLINGSKEVNPAMVAAAAAIGGALLVSVVNLGIKMTRTAISVVQDVASMTRSAVSMGQKFAAGFANAALAAEDGAGKIGKLGGAFRSALPAIGGAAAVLGAVGAAIAVNNAMSHTAVVDTEQMTKALADFADAGNKAGVVELDRQFQDWSNTMTRASSNVSTVNDAIKAVTHQDFGTWLNNQFDGVNAALGMAKTDVGQFQDRLKAVGDQLGAMAKGGATDQASMAFGRLAQAYKDNGKSAQDALDAMPGYAQALKDQAAAAGVTLSQTDLLQFALGKIPDSMAAAMGATQKYTDAAGNAHAVSKEMADGLKQVGIDASGSVTDLDAFRKSLEALGGKQVSAREAQANMNKALRDAKAAVNDMEAGGQKLGTGLNKLHTDFDTTTQAGADLQDKFLSVRQTGLDLANSIDGTGADAQAKIQTALNNTYTNLVNTAHGMGITGNAADALAKQVLGVPTGVDIKTWMDQFAATQLARLKGQADATNGTTVTITTNLVTNRVTRDFVSVGGGPGPHASGGSEAYANGGLVGGYPSGGLLTGPGTGTSDSIIARVSNGEYIIRQASVSKYGVDFLNAINRGVYGTAPGSPSSFPTSHAGVTGGTPGGAAASSQLMARMALGELMDDMNAVTATVEKYKDAAGRTHAVSAQMATDLQNVGLSAKGSITDMSKFTAGLEGLGDGVTTTRQKSAGFQTSMRDVRGYMSDRRKTIADQIKAWEAAHPKVKGAARARIEAGIRSRGMVAGLNSAHTDFDLSTQAGSEMQDKLLAVRQSGLDLANTITGTDSASQKRFQSTLTGTYNSVVNAAQQMGITGAGAIKLARSILGIPPGVSVTSWMSQYAKRQTGSILAAGARADGPTIRITNDMVQKAQTAINNGKTVGTSSGASVIVHATTNASPQQIASEVGWALRNQN